MATFAPRLKALAGWPPHKSWRWVAREIAALIAVAIIVQIGLYLFLGPYGRADVLMDALRVKPGALATYRVPWSQFPDRNQKGLSQWAHKQQVVLCYQVDDKFLDITTDEPATLAADRIGLPLRELRWKTIWEYPFAFRSSYEHFDIDYSPVYGEATWIFVFGKWIKVSDSGNPRNRY